MADRSDFKKQPAPADGFGSQPPPDFSFVSRSVADMEEVRQDTEHRGQASAPYPPPPFHQMSADSPKSAPPIATITPSQYAHYMRDPRSLEPSNNQLVYQGQTSYHSQSLPAQQPHTLQSQARQHRYPTQGSNAYLAGAYPAPSSHTPEPRYSTPSSNAYLVGAQPAPHSRTSYPPPLSTYGGYQPATLLRNPGGDWCDWCDTSECVHVAARSTASTNSTQAPCYQPKPINAVGPADSEYPYLPNPPTSTYEHWPSSTSPGAAQSGTAYPATRATASANNTQANAYQQQPLNAVNPADSGYRNLPPLNLSPSWQPPSPVPYSSCWCCFTATCTAHLQTTSTAPVASTQADSFPPKLNNAAEAAQRANLSPTLSLSHSSYGTSSRPDLNQRSSFSFMDLILSPSDFDSSTPRGSHTTIPAQLEKEATGNKSVETSSLPFRDTAMGQTETPAAAKSQQNEKEPGSQRPVPHMSTAAIIAIKEEATAQKAQADELAARKTTVQQAPTSQQQTPQMSIAGSSSNSGSTVAVVREPSQQQPEASSSAAVDLSGPSDQQAVQHRDNEGEMTSMESPSRMLSPTRVESPAPMESSARLESPARDSDDGLDSDASDSDLTELNATASNDPLSEEECEEESEPERAVTPQSEDGIDLFDKYAFNTVRDGYNHRIPQHYTTGTTIKVTKFVGQTYTLNQYRKDQKEKFGSDVALAPPVIPDITELEGDGSFDSIWIGMLPSLEALIEAGVKNEEPADDDAGEGTSKKPARKRRNNPPSGAISALREGHFRALDFDRNAFRVVAKKSKTITKETHIYALVLNPLGARRCIAYKVPWDDVFFFREFRDDSIVKLQARKQAILAKVKAMVFPDAADAPLPVANSSKSLALSNGESSGQEAVKDSPVTPSSKTAASTSQKPLKSQKSTLRPIATPKSAKTSAQNVDRKSASKDKSSKAPKSLTKREKIRAGKRKVGDVDPLSEDDEDQQDGARKKARTDNSMQESVQGDDRPTSSRTGECSGGAPSGFLGFHTPDATQAAANEDDHAEDDDDDSGDAADPEHVVAPGDPSYMNLIDNILSNFSSHANSPAPTAAKEKMSLCSSERNSSTVLAQGGDAGDNEQAQRASHADHLKDVVVDGFTQLINQLAAENEKDVLQQALVLLKSLMLRRDPPKTNALSLCLNIPRGLNIELDKCEEQMKQLRALFPTLTEDPDLQPAVLAWMAKGLQVTGQSVSLPLIRPYFTAFAAMYEAHGHGNGFTRAKLVDMIVEARDKAEAMLRAERAELDGAADDDDGPSHPRVDVEDLDEELELVSRAYIWTAPGDRSEGESALR